MLRQILLPTVFALAAGPAVSLAQEPPPPLIPKPQQVTDSTVARGREIFNGAGNCVACHGIAGVGTDSGPPIAQGVWMHGPDSYEGILARVVHGVPKAYSTRGLAMPMRGWNTLSDREARDVAAYVWSISHAWRPDARPKKPS
ncbi:MAG TPA: cytochrome c [Gemmatimonadales bacterium]|jgi:mono/diheme cytochrome c family protein